MSRSIASARDYQLISSFDSVCESLKQDIFQDRRKKPLAYWALPNDRRLPLAFLSRTIEDLINTPFDDLSATPGIGQKKISSLVKLLMRATREHPPETPFGLTELSDPEGRENDGIPFDAFLVSEALWSEWQQTVRDKGLQDELMGRVAPTLRSIPTVIWSTPLAQYLDLSLAQIRKLRTHGEKRVRCILQVFHSVHEAVRQSGPGDDLRRLLGSPLIRDVSDWIRQVLREDRTPNRQEVCEHLAEPILQQIEIDCGRTVGRIARQRVGVDDEVMSVRTQAQEMGVTRARVYQLLDDCHKVIAVRWPDGEQSLMMLNMRCSHSADSLTGDLLLGVRQLCFPERQHDELG